MKNPLTPSKSIKNRIHTIRGFQIILDRDLAALYGVETRSLKQAVNRNKKRFPEDFMLVLTDKEIDFLVSQSVIPSKKHLGGALPYAFTEQGVANLSSVLTSAKAIDVNIQIMRAFVEMRKFIQLNAQIFQRLDFIERKQFIHDEKFKNIFNALETEKPKQGIFFDGQIFDSHKFVSDLIRSAEKSIILIDNYIDDSVLTLFTKKNNNVSVIIYTKNLTKQLKLDLDKYNSQYSEIEVKKFNNSHDRFMIIDNKDVYHIGASLKDLGKKWFAFSKFEKEAAKMLEKVVEKIN